MAMMRPWIIGVVILSFTKEYHAQQERRETQNRIQARTRKKQSSGAVQYNCRSNNKEQLESKLNHNTSKRNVLRGSVRHQKDDFDEKKEERNKGSRSGVPRIINTTVTKTHTTHSKSHPLISKQQQGYCEESRFCSN
jgi:hypothetical protein